MVVFNRSMFSNYTISVSEASKETEGLSKFCCCFFVFRLYVFVLFLFLFFSRTNSVSKESKETKGLSRWFLSRMDSFGANPAASVCTDRTEAISIQSDCDNRRVWIYFLSSLSGSLALMKSWIFADICRDHYPCYFCCCRSDEVLIQLCHRCYRCDSGMKTEELWKPKSVFMPNLSYHWRHWKLSRWQPTWLCIPRPLTIT